MRRLQALLVMLIGFCGYVALGHAPSVTGPTAGVIGGGGGMNNPCIGRDDGTCGHWTDADNDGEFCDDGQELWNDLIWPNHATGDDTPTTATDIDIYGPGPGTYDCNLRMNWCSDTDGPGGETNAGGSEACPKWQCCWDVVIPKIGTIQVCDGLGGCTPFCDTPPCPSPCGDNDPATATCEDHVVCDPLVGSETIPDCDPSPGHTLPALHFRTGWTGAQIRPDVGAASNEGGSCPWVSTEAGSWWCNFDFVDSANDDDRYWWKLGDAINDGPTGVGAVVEVTMDEPLEILDIGVDPANFAAYNTLQWDAFAPAGQAIKLNLTQNPAGGVGNLQLISSVAYGAWDIDFRTAHGQASSSGSAFFIPISGEVLTFRGASNHFWQLCNYVSEEEGSVVCSTAGQSPGGTVIFDTTFKAWKRFSVNFSQALSSFVALNSVFNLGDSIRPGPYKFTGEPPETTKVEGYIECENSGCIILDKDFRQATINAHIRAIHDSTGGVPSGGTDGIIAENQTDNLTGVLNLGPAFRYSHPWDCDSSTCQPIDDGAKRIHAQVVGPEHAVWEGTIPGVGPVSGDHCLNFDTRRWVADCSGATAGTEIPALKHLWFSEVRGRLLAAETDTCDLSLYVDETKVGQDLADWFTGSAGDEKEKWFAAYVDPTSNAVEPEPTNDGNWTPGTTGNVAVSSTAGFPASGNYTIRVEAEDILASTVNGTTLNLVTRGYNETQAAAHGAGSDIQYRQPVVVTVGVDFDEAGCDTIPDSWLQLEWDPLDVRLYVPN